MLRATNPRLIAPAASATIITGTAAWAESIEAAASQPDLSGGPRPIDECGDYGMTTNSTLYGGTTCGLGNDVPEWMSCAGQFTRGEDASIELIVPEPGFYDITLDPLGNPWVSVMVHESCPHTPAGVSMENLPHGTYWLVIAPAPDAETVTCDDDNHYTVTLTGEPSCPADFTGSDGNPDGVVNVTDLLELLAAWGDCPEV